MLESVRLLSANSPIKNLEVVILKNAVGARKQNPRQQKSMTLAKWDFNLMLVERVLLHKAWRSYPQHGQGIQIKAYVSLPSGSKHAQQRKAVEHMLKTTHTIINLFKS